MLRYAPALAIITLAGPIFFGLAATLLPAFGYFPALGGDSISLDPWRQLLAEPGLLRSVLISLASGLVASLIAFVLAMLLIASWQHSRWFWYGQHLVSPLLAVPHAAAAFGLAFMISPSGWLLRLVSPGLTGFERPPDWLVIADPYGFAMIAGLAVKEFPFLLLIMLATMAQARPREMVMAASTMGYGRIAAFIHGPWPRIYPQIRLAIFAVIAYSSSAVDVAAILGPTNPPPLAVRLVGWMNDADLSRRFMASAGALLQLGVTATAILIWISGERICGLCAVASRRSGRRFANDRALASLSGLLATIPVLAVFGGLVLLALWSVAGFWPFPDILPTSLTLVHWDRHLPSVVTPLYNTAIIAGCAVALALALTLACLEREARNRRSAGNRLMWIVYLPLMIPQISFVFGLQLFFLLADISASYIAVVLVHLTFVLPYCLLSLADPWRAWDPRFGWVAQSLGASPDRVFWRIRLPMLTRPVLVAAAVGFAVSVGQYLPTLLVGAGRWPTITTEAVALASGGDRRIVGIYAFFQMLLPMIAFSAAMVIPAIMFFRRRAM